MAGKIAAYIVMVLYGVFAIALKIIWDVPLANTLIGFALFGLVMHLVTLDSYAAGGWDNPDGTKKFPWLVTVVHLGFVLLALGLKGLIVYCGL